jgi:hypothetical protein
MVSESKIENSIPLLERDVEAQDAELDKRNDDPDVLPVPTQAQGQAQAAARKKFLTWTAIK